MPANGCPAAADGNGPNDAIGLAEVKLPVGGMAAIPFGSLSRIKNPQPRKGGLAVPGLEHHRVNLVPPPEIARCAFCGTDYRDGLSFVCYDNNPDSEPVPAGLIETVDKQAGQHVYTARDAFGRGSNTVSLELPQVCSECMTQAAALLGLEDVTPLQARAR